MRRVIIFVIAGLGLSGCGLFQKPQPDVVVINTACQSFRPILPTSNDIDVISDGLAMDLSTHNEVGARICGWGP